MTIKQQKLQIQKPLVSFFNKMLESGVFLPPSQFEAAFVSYAHSDTELSKTLDAVEKSIKLLE